MRVLNYAYRQSTDPLLNHLWVVFEKTTTGNSPSPLALVNTEDEAKQIARDHFIQNVTEQIEAVIGIDAHKQLHWFANSAFSHRHSITKAVRDYFIAHMIDIKTLTPLTGSCEEFSTEVKKLTSPYMPICDTHYESLMKAPFDYYLSAGGTVMTFGGTSSTDTAYNYALMPLQPKFAKEILDTQTSNSKSSGN